MLLKPEVGFGNAVCFDYSHEGESVPTEPDELERRILVVPEGCRR